VALTVKNKEEFLDITQEFLFIIINKLIAPQGMILFEQLL